MLYCFKCPACKNAEERSLPIAFRNDEQRCACGAVMQRDKSRELAGTVPERGHLSDLHPPHEKTMNERVRSGEFNLAREFDAIGGPKLFEK